MVDKITIAIDQVMVASGSNLVAFHHPAYGSKGHINSCSSYVLARFILNGSHNGHHIVLHCVIIVGSRHDIGCFGVFFQGLIPISFCLFLSD